MTRQRRHHSPEDKIRILRRHLLEEIPVSDLCEKEGIHPTLFYQWQKQFFEHGAAVFAAQSRGPRRRNLPEEKIAALEAKLQRKNEVLSELLEEHTRLK